MLKTENFRLHMTPEEKQKLEFLAKQEGRSQANMIGRLIIEKYQAVTEVKAADPRRDHQPSNMATV